MDSSNLTSVNNLLVSWWLRVLVRYGRVCSFDANSVRLPNARPRRRNLIQFLRVWILLCYSCFEYFLFTANIATRNSFWFSKRLNHSRRTVRAGKQFLWWRSCYFVCRNLRSGIFLNSWCWEWLFSAVLTQVLKKEKWCWCTL